MARFTTRLCPLCRSSLIYERRSSHTLAHRYLFASCCRVDCSLINTTLHVVNVLYAPVSVIYNKVWRICYASLLISTYWKLANQFKTLMNCKPFPTWLYKPCVKISLFNRWKSYTINKNCFTKAFDYTHPSKRRQQIDVANCQHLCFCFLTHLTFNFKTIGIPI